MKHSITLTPFYIYYIRAHLHIASKLRRFFRGYVRIILWNFDDSHFKLIFLMRKVYFHEKFLDIIEKFVKNSMKRRWNVDEDSMTAFSIFGMLCV